MTSMNKNFTGHILDYVEGMFDCGRHVSYYWKIMEWKQQCKKILKQKSQKKRATKFVKAKPSFGSQTSYFHQSAWEPLLQFNSSEFLLSIKTSSCRGDLELKTLLSHKHKIDRREWFQAMITGKEVVEKWRGIYAVVYAHYHPVLDLYDHTLSHGRFDQCIWPILFIQTALQLDCTITYSV